MQSVTRREFMAVSAAMAAVAAAQPGGAMVADGRFMAGVATRDITPRAGVAMWGYGDREGPSTGALDPLHARALVLKAGDTAIAIVTMDLGRVPPVRVLNRVRSEIAEHGIAHAVFTASHTHGGPVLEIEEEPHVQAIGEKLAACVQEAAANLVPVKAGIASALFDISHNRRIVTADGKCEMLWRNEKKIPTSPVDREATVIKLETTDGKPFATIVHFACHPVVLGRDNREYTADWVGAMCGMVKKATGAECLYLQGGCGDINPYLDKTPLDEGGVESMRAVGSEAAKAVLAVLPKIETKVPVTPSLRYCEKHVEIGTRWDFTNPKQQDVFRGVYGGIFDRYLQGLQKDLAVPLAVLVVNNDVAFAFVPGELFTRHQLDFKRFAPLWPEVDSPAAEARHHRRRALLVGYSNDFHIYFPTIADAAAGGYGGVAATYVGIGAGEKLVLEAQSEVGRLTGRLKDFCTSEDFEVIDAKTA